jgi:nitrate reductase beta subunit
VGRIRYIGLLLYDADAIEEAARSPQESLVQAQRDVIKDPFDPEVIAAAKASGIPDSKIMAAQQSPVYQFVKKWGLALPLHPEFRTLPMLFYVPPLGPVLAKTGNGVYDNVAAEARLGPLMSSLERSRIPLRYMASLLTGGNEQIIRDVYNKLVAVRVYMRAKKVGDIPQEEVERALTKGKTTAAEVEAIFRLTSLPTFEERFVVPPMERDTSVESMFPMLDPVSRNYPTYKGAVGAGFHIDPARGP